MDESDDDLDDKVSGNDPSGFLSAAPRFCPLGREEPFFVRLILVS